MAKVKYYAKENSTIGTHSFYAVPIPNGTLTFDDFFVKTMNKKYGANYTMWAYMDDIKPKLED